MEKLAAVSLSDLRWTDPCPRSGSDFIPRVEIGAGPGRVPERGTSCS